MKRVVVTGSNGLIGNLVMDAWRASGRYDVVGLARSEGPYTDILADTSDLDALVNAFTGADAVVHLAGSSAVESSWEDVLESNIIGLRNVFEAARIAGVKRVVFSSSNHAVGMFEVSNKPDVWEMHDTRQIDHTSEILPDSYYGVSKAYGEAMARYYVDHHVTVWKPCVCGSAHAQEATSRHRPTTFGNRSETTNQEFGNSVPASALPG